MAIELERKSLLEIIKTVKERIIENKLTLKEISKNIAHDEKLIAFVLNEENNVLKAISDTITFMKIRMKEEKMSFNTYLLFTDGGTQVKITRILHPKCHVYFDKPSQQFLNFEMKYKGQNISKAYKQLIINEMTEFYKENTEKT